MQLWQQHHNLKNMNVNLGSGGGNLGSSSLPAGATTCQDCGNQAKKDCPHRRCRTCCKSRGYDCSTHVKSTWVPAARRRERQVMGGTAAAGSSHHQSITSSGGAKKPRLIGGASQTTTTTTAASHNTSTSNTTPPRSFETTSSHHQDVSYKERLPGEVSAPAVFKCVRVTAVDGDEDEYAYQAVVRIGGHVFKGFLYDQGRSDQGFPNISELHLGGRNGGASSSHGVVDPTTTTTTTSDIFGASGGGLLGGSAYGNSIN